MGNIFKIVPVMIVVAVCCISAVSCEKEIEFSGKETQPRLVLYSLAAPGEKLSADLSCSVFFLKRNYGGNLFTEGLDTKAGSVKVYVNGSPEPLEMRFAPTPDDVFLGATTLHYEADYEPEPGDHIRMTADFPGFDRVEGEITVPLAGGLEILSSRRTVTEEGSVSYDVSARVTDYDPAGTYYYLVPVRFASYDGGETWQRDYTYHILSQDPLFMENTSDVASVFDDSQSSNYFSERLFRGKSYEFRFSFNPGPYDYHYNTTGGFYIPSDADGDNVEIKFRYSIDLITLTESLYNHVLSMQSVSESFYGLFSESATLYSNVKGGYGCICSSVSLSLPFE